MKILSIDPSIYNLGIAIFELSNNAYDILSNTSIVYRIEKLIYSDVIKVMKARPGKDETYITCLDRMIGLVMAHIPNELDLVVIELPDFVAFAPQEIFKLTGLVYSLRQACLQRDLRVELVPVAIWKGQVPKEVTLARVRKRWKVNPQDHNESDAIGIGTWMIDKIREIEVIKITTADRKVYGSRRKNYDLNRKVYDPGKEAISIAPTPHQPRNK